MQEASRGQDLMDVVCKHLNLLETAYFGLRFVDAAGQPVSISALRSRLRSLAPEPRAGVPVGAINCNPVPSSLCQHWLSLNRRAVKQLQGKVQSPLIAFSLFPETDSLFPDPILLPILIPGAFTFSPHRLASSQSIFWSQVLRRRPVQACGGNHQV